MATISQIKALMNAHFNDDQEKFRVISLQIAAHEAKIGHSTGAQEIKKLVQNSSRKNSNILKMTNKNELTNFQYADVQLDELVVSSILRTRITRILEEYRKRNYLFKNGLKNRSKLLLEGEPGTGKTLTASVIASELGLPLFTIQLEKLISKYMGETSVKLKKLFESIYEYKGVYLFDEFDAIGADRGFDNDVGEMRRVLNSFLQYIEQDDSSSIIIAATNNPKMLDKALFRRFDDVLQYGLPDEKQIQDLIKMYLHHQATKDVLAKDVIKEAIGLNHAEVVIACKEALKFSLLQEQIISKNLFLSFIQERKALTMYKGG